jgi:hypothetical protein
MCWEGEGCAVRGVVIVAPRDLPPLRFGLTLFMAENDANRIVKNRTSAYLYWFLAFSRNEKS